MTDKDLIARLQIIASSFLRIPFPKERPFDGVSFLSRAGLFEGELREDLEQLVGISGSAAGDLVALADGIRAGDPQYSANTDKTAFQKATAKAVIKVLAVEPAGVAMGDPHLAAVRLSLAQWWAKQILDRTFIVPCILTPYQSAPFSIGPVSFWHGTDWDTLRRPQYHPFPYGTTMDPIFAEMGRRSAHWIAEVRVVGHELTQAQGTADLAVDAAITSIQLSDPSLFKNAARITTRAMPVVRLDSSYDSTGIYGGIKNLEPGRTLTPQGFNTLIQLHRPFLDSAGRRIATFITGGSKLPQLERSWVDAALWFHEGISDKLNTIAVAKMETAIEVLLYAESTSGSNKRIRSVFKAFMNRNPKDPIHPGLPTVETFVQKIVTARSRILHGTLSTASADTDAERMQAQGLALELLIAYSGHLDGYLADPTSQDDTDAFLEWVQKKLFP